MLLYDTSRPNELHKDSHSRTSINITMIVEQTAPVGGRWNMAVTVTEPEICSGQTHQTVKYEGQFFYSRPSRF